MGLRLAMCAIHARPNTKHCCPAQHSFDRQVSGLLSCRRCDGVDHHLPLQALVQTQKPLISLFHHSVLQGLS